MQLKIDAGHDQQDFQNCDYSTSTVVDARNLLVLGTSVSGTLVPYSYDADGRITATTTPGLNGCQILGPYVKIYKYDAEDHTTFTYDFGTPSNVHYYSWGPNGHPVTVGECHVSYTPQPTCGSAQNGPWLYSALHWDGDALLFVTRADGALTDYKLAADGDDLPTDAQQAGVVYYDRDLSGQARELHNAGGSKATIGSYSGATSSPEFYDSAAGPTFTYQRTDGITDGSSTLQGVRNYSPDSLQWTTPDAFSGDVGDPMSQSKYTWNNNNPIAYDDSTGYESGKPCTGSASGDPDPGNSNCVLTTVHSVPDPATVAKELDQTFSPNNRALVLNTVLDAGMAGSGGVLEAFVGGGTLEGGGEAIVAGRAEAVHSALDPIATRMRTTAALDTNQGRFIASGGVDLTRLQRMALLPGEIAASLSGAHAEVTALTAAERSGAILHALAATRDICPLCADLIESKGGIMTGPRTAIFPK